MNDLRSLLTDVAGEAVPVDLTPRVTAGVRRRTRRRRTLTAVLSVVVLAAGTAAASGLLSGMRSGVTPPTRGAGGFDAVWFSRIGGEDAYRVLAQVAGHRRVELGTVRDSVVMTDLSPDGRRVAFSRLDGFGVIELTRGVPVRNYTVPGDSPGQAFEVPTWSPDGRTILHHHLDPDSDAHRYAGFSLVDVATGAAQYVERRNAGKSAWSPDGSLIALTVDGGGVEIVTRNGHVVRRFGGAGWFVAAPHAWSPDGAHLAVRIYGENGSDSIRDVVVTGTGEIVVTLPRIQTGIEMVWRGVGHVAYADQGVVKEYGLDGSARTVMRLDRYGPAWSPTLRPAS